MDLAQTSTHTMPQPEVSQGSRVHSCQGCLSPVISSQFTAKWREWVILMQPRHIPGLGRALDSCWKSFRGCISVPKPPPRPPGICRLHPWDKWQLIQRGGPRAPALFRVLWCCAMQGSHLGSAVHLHGYLHLLMFGDDIHRGVPVGPTHTPRRRHTFVFGTNVSPDNPGTGGHTRWGSPRGEVACSLDEISLILKRQ